MRYVVFNGAFVHFNHEEFVFDTSSASLISAMINEPVPLCPL